MHVQITPQPVVEIPELKPYIGFISEMEPVENRMGLVALPHENQPLECRISENMQLSILIPEDVQVIIHVVIEAAVTRCSLELFLQKNAACTCLTFQPESSADIHIVQRARLEDGASLRWQNATLNRNKVRQNLQTELVGANAVCNVDWMFFANEKDIYELRAQNTYQGRNGGGEIMIKGVAAHKAHVRCDGLINIGLHGTGTDAYLTEDVLMLDPSAKVDAVPGLEIKTNDVKASHSATVARVTPEDLFYFAARGIASEEARHMYVLGFLSGLMDTISDEQTHSQIVGLIEQKMAIE